MEQRQLEFFVAVAEELSFTRAARRTHAVQSTVSASVRALERELGATLFDRTTTRVGLTEAGRALLPEARRSLDSLGQARAAVDGTRAGVTGSLRIGTLAGLTTVDLPSLAGEFRRRHPGVHLSLRIDAAGSDGLLTALHSRELDVAFVGVESTDLPGLLLEPITTFQPRLLVPAGHALAERRSVTRTQLAGESFIDLPVGFCNRGRTDADFRGAGISRSIAVEVSDVTTIPGYVESGIGVALVPPLATEAGARVVAVELDPPAHSWTLALARLASAEPTRATRALLDMAGDYVNRNGCY
ncbi:LysR family transcriptional regulator [Actinoplanes sp. CA-142083]|uniref:LysR family transcriptional regulator n=1 Tax=Actinoplanes sp. CA-142083 TaxID=3239903 RepID=UPI003D8E1987